MKVLNNTDYDEWQEIADKCEYATFFHTPAWYEVFAQTLPGSRIATQTFLWDDGKTAVFPLLRTISMRGLLETYQSSPAGCYGGWISRDKLGPDQVAEMTKWIRQNFKNLGWRLNPFAEGSNEETLLCPTREDSTQILRLNRFQDEESLLKNYKHSVRKQIAKGRRAKLTVTAASCWDHWEKYFEIYRMTLARWGDKATSSYSLEFFRRIYELHSPSVQLWLVLNEDQVVGGNLNFYHGRHCVEWHAAYDSNFFAVGVRNFLVHNIILDALNRGYTIYDFNPSGGHEGTRSFKKSFGGEALPCGSIFQKTIRTYFLNQARLNCFRAAKLSKSIRTGK